MSSTRDRSGSSLSNFALQDFGVLSLATLRNSAAVLTGAPAGGAPFTAAPDSASLSLGRLQPFETTSETRTSGHIQFGSVARHDADGALAKTGATPVASHAIDAASFSDRHVSVSDHTGSLVATYSGFATVVPPVSDANAFVPAGMQFGSFNALGERLAAADFGNRPDAAAHGDGHLSAPPSGVPVTGQLWYGAQGSDGGTSSGSSDNQVGHIDSDTAGRDVSDVSNQFSDPGFQAIGLDTAAGLYFALSGDGVLRSGHITNDTETGENSQTSQTLSNQVGGEIQTIFSTDEVNTFAVDPVHHIIYLDLFGQTDDNTAIIKISYNPVTGVMTSPYNSSTGVLTGGSTLISNTSTAGTLVDATAMHYDIASGKLYYIDDDLTYSSNGGTNETWRQSEGIYVVDTTSGSPTATLLSSQVQFPVDESNGYMAGMAVDAEKGIIYFTTNDVGSHTTTVWWMPIAGGTATAMTIPGGVTLHFTGYFGSGSNAMTIDDNNQQLYIADNDNSHIVQLTLSTDGHSFTGGNSNFEVFDSNANSAYTGALLFDDLPVLTNIVGTTTETVQGGAAVTQLTATPAISDHDDANMGYAQVIITNAQAGDILSANTSGTAITASYNTTTHTLTLSGDDTFAHYQQVLDSVQFQDTGTDNSTGSHPTRTIDWVLSDGTTIFDQTTSDSNEQATTLVIDRAPTLTADNYAVVESATSTGTPGTAGTGVLGNDIDKDADAITVTAVQGSGANVGNFVTGTYGQLQLNHDGSYTYNANNTSVIDAAAFGSHPVDTFTYTVSDGLGGVTTTTVSFTIDRAPTVAADNPAGEALESGSAIIGNVLTNDTDHDGDALTVSAVNGTGSNVGNFVSGTYGQIKINSDGSYSYSASDFTAIDAAATGSHLIDTFTYTDNDGHGGTTTTTITVTVDRAPTAVSDSSTGDAVESGTNATGNVLGNDSDRDGDTLVVSAVNGVGGNVGISVAGTYGHVTINPDGSYTYSADDIAVIDGAATGSHLTDTFNYTASDGFGGTAMSTLTVTLDRAPTVVGDSNSTGESGSLNVNAASGVLANDSDRDGDSLTISAVSGSGDNVGTSTPTTYGHITLNADGSYDYTADNTMAIDAAPTGSHPVDTISFTVSDGFGGFTSETLSITLDRPAVAAADALSTTEDADAVNGSGNPNLLANDIDKDGDAIVITAVNGSGVSVGTQITLASGALLTVNANGSYDYNPNHAFDYLPGAGSGASNTTATDTFTYTVDGGSTVTVTITINGVDSNDKLTGTIGDDTLHGGIGDDQITPLSGTDQVFGDSGNDYIGMGAYLTASDQIDGGTGTDHVILNGDYSGGVVFNATTMVNVEFLSVTAGFSYNLTMDNATVAAGQTLTVQAGTLGAGDSLVFDGSADVSGGNFVITGGAGNDTITGGSGDDVIHSGGGADTVHGGGGNDLIGMGANFTAADQLDGGSGTDDLVLDGDYSGGVVFGAATVTNIEAFSLAAGHSYNLTINDATVAAGQTLMVFASTLGAGDSLVFDGSADVTGGNFAIVSGAGNDTLTGGHGDDTFRPGTGNDTIHGGDGNDTISIGAGLTAADRIDGGNGLDTLVLNGDYSAGVTFGATTVTNVEVISLIAGHDYNLTASDGTVALGATMTVKATGLGAGDSLTFDGSADQDGGSFIINGGAGNDTLTGGYGNDTIRGGNGTNTITGGGGSDTLYGGSGADQFVYTGVSDSTSTGFDKVHGYDALADTFKLTGDAVNAINATITGGHLSTTTMDTDLATAIGAVQLGAHDAVLFDPDTGNLHGHMFLIVDANGVAGYQAGQDFVIDITGATNIASLSTADFVG